VRLVVPTYHGHCQQVILGKVNGTYFQIVRQTIIGISVDLRKDKVKPPRYSLANGLWIGEIPWELQRLTFPEQMLIALLYPRVYVFKLFTKSIHQPGYSALQRGMRGTVSTYKLDTDAIASMVQGNLMPRFTAMLSEIISITFIGTGKASESLSCLTAGCVGGFDMAKE